MDKCKKCGGTGFPAGACNCAGDVTGCDGVCGSGLVFDACNKCDGPGYPEGACDCAG